MIRLFLRIFVKNCDDTENKRVREGYGTLSGVLGLCCNFVLFLVKLTVGTLMSSIAVISDAFNNLSDMGASAMAVISAKMSNRKPDADHPFGHGRFEYIASLIISFFIMVVGLELLKSAVDKIFHPQPIEMRPVLLIILLLSVFVKLWMWAYNRYLGRRIDSPVLLATAADSLNDVLATSAVVASTFLGYYLNLHIDGYIGAAVSLLILWVGFDLARSTVSVLLGNAPDRQLVCSLEKMLCDSDCVLGVHDLIVHDYGPGRVFASVHAEVSDRQNITAVHEEIDALERRAAEEMGIELVIHMDPISSDCTVLNAAREMVVGLVRELGDFSIHDFRMTDGENRVNLIFDLVVPPAMTERQRTALTDALRQRLQQTDPKYHAVIHLDNDYACNQK